MSLNRKKLQSIAPFGFLALLLILFIKGCGESPKKRSIEGLIQASLEDKLPSEEDLLPVSLLKDDIIKKEILQDSFDSRTQTVRQRLEEFAEKVNTLKAEISSVTPETLRAEIEGIRETVLLKNDIPRYYIEEPLNYLTRAKYSDDPREQLAKAQAAIQEAIASPTLKRDIEAYGITEKSHHGVSSNDLLEQLQSGDVIDHQKAIEALSKVPQKVSQVQAQIKMDEKKAQLQNLAELNLESQLEDVVDQESGSLIAKAFIQRVKESGIQPSENEIRNLAEKSLRDLKKPFDPKAVDEITQTIQKELQATEEFLKGSEASKKIIQRTDETMAEIDTLEKQRQRGEITDDEYEKHTKQKIKQYEDEVKRAAAELDQKIRSIAKRIEQIDREILSKEKNLKELTRVKGLAQNQLDTLSQLIKKCKDAEYRKSHSSECDNLEMIRQKLQSQIREIDEDIRDEKKAIEELKRKRRNEEQVKKALEVTKIALAAMIISAAIAMAFINPPIALAMFLAGMALLGSGSDGGGQEGGPGGKWSNYGGEAGEYADLAGTGEGTETGVSDIPGTGEGVGTGGTGISSEGEGTGKGGTVPSTIEGTEIGETDVSNAGKGAGAGVNGKIESEFGSAPFKVKPGDDWEFTRRSGDYQFIRDKNSGKEYVFHHPRSANWIPKDGNSTTIPFSNRNDPYICGIYLSGTNPTLGGITQDGYQFRIILWPSDINFKQILPNKVSMTIWENGRCVSYSNDEEREKCCDSISKQTVPSEQQPPDQRRGKLEGAFQKSEKLEQKPEERPGQGKPISKGELPSLPQNAPAMESDGWVMPFGSDRDDASKTARTVESDGRKYIVKFEFDGTDLISVYTPEGKKVARAPAKMADRAYNAYTRETERGIRLKRICSVAEFVNDVPTVLWGVDFQERVVEYPLVEPGKETSRDVIIHRKQGCEGAVK
jgi:hypothetical protein